MEHAMRAFTTCLFLGALAASALAQEGAGDLSTPVRTASRAQTVAAEVQTFYDQADTFQARFTQTYYHRLYRRYQRSTGRLYFDKPGRMRFDYAAPNGKVIVSNGTHLTAFDPGDDGEAGQYFKTEVGDNALSRAFGFLTGEGRILDDYHVRLLNARAWRWSGEILELRPRVADPRIARIVLYVDGDASRPGVVHRIRIDDHEGNRNKFELRRMRFNRDIPASRFRYTPPAGSHRL